MKKQKDPVPWTQLLKRTKGEIVAFLRALPPTQHDLNSIVVDMGIQTENMIYFSVNGKFKEVGRMCEVRVCTFTRTFVLTAGRNSSIRILNDQLTVTDVSHKETQSAFSPGPSFGPAPSQEQQ
ncbi:nuclear RNA export factor 2-like [Echinops telfairi]|uniref:Nuclear RNA export factor 2-like n=3 Tax=Echinops telfairi TaxID=9371 RepID=A0AC55D4A4_ECHTE|nr:nuclear RNA export factor 2-like [Echinops telfairi]XP_045146560.1 nuclear RNA export factor 2-like [Echinops telfairi]XP_045146561.1 nuclear RNA export factor 2-like [Echinops telfairi]